MGECKMQSGQQLPPPPEPTPAIRFSRPVTVGETVTVACKVPNGLLLRIFAEYTYMDPQQDGTSKPTKAYREIPNKRFAVKGPWAASAGQAYMRNNSAVAELLPGGYALTYGVPKDIWDKWYEQNRDTPLVQKRVIFATTSMAQATIDAKNERAVQSGLEPVDPDNPAAKLPGGRDRELRNRGQLRLSMLDEGEPGTTQR
jgi:hypothetical protein